MMEIRIRELRKAKKMTMTQLADAAGITPQSVWNYENEHCYPNLIVSLAIARVLGCHVEDLVDTKKEATAT